VRILITDRHTWTDLASAQYFHREIDRSGKAAENILYESSDKVQLPRESKSAVNALYAATNALFAATNGTSDRV
jgi:hypothetical protein